VCPAISVSKYVVLLSVISNVYRRQRWCELGWCAGELGAACRVCGEMRAAIVEVENDASRISCLEKELSEAKHQLMESANETIAVYKVLYKKQAMLDESYMAHW
jgi:hypothetical protein